MPILGLVCCDETARCCLSSYFSSDVSVSDILAIFPEYVRPLDMAYHLLACARFLQEFRHFSTSQFSYLVHYIRMKLRGTCAIVAE